ncbi:MAG: hypothetical protein HY281_09070 [Nitrospirae bacterium]|nr:hypothetical protein [Nitrospirota bacterium]
MIDNLLEADSLNAYGKITRRQTTFWDIVLTDSGPHRIYFHGKHEFFFHGEDFLGFAVYDNHPLLMDYVEEWRNVYLASAVEDTEPLISRLSQAVADLTGNWRPVYRYLNSCFGTRALLQSGNGLLLAGPRTIVDGISPLFAEYGVATSILKGMPARGAPRVLVLG